MESFPIPRPPAFLVPQVGAILHLDTELSPPGMELGSKHWALDGSCVLVAPDRILTVRHTLVKTATSAAFFPYEGLVMIGEERSEDYEYGDSMCLCILETPVRSVKPLPYAWKARKDLVWGLISGYGRWTNMAGWELDGIQRSVAVKLHLEGPGGETEYGHPLDLQWAPSRNQGLAAGRNNSGGPVLYSGQPDPTVLALMRETRGEHHAASRIADRRKNEWLDPQFAGLDAPSPILPLKRCPPRMVDFSYGEGVAEEYEVPAGAVEIHITLSATPGLRLQMGIGRPEDDELPERLAGSDESSGRFLVRRAVVPGGASRVIVVIEPVRSAPIRAEGVQAQLCCMFT